MQNIRLTLQYSGSRYLGWQRPKKDGYEKTVSYKILSVLHKMTGEDLCLYAGARTDPGVHALAQTVNFHTDSGLSPEEFRAGLNQYLPQDIAVLDAAAAPERFRADLNARSRTYEYRICTAPVYDVFTRGYTAHISPMPDIDLMKTAADILIGKHDFGCFSGARKKKGTEKNLMNICFETIGKAGTSPAGNAGLSTDILRITLTADEFLYQMPLRIVSVLLETGRGQRMPESIKNLFARKETPGISCETKGLLLRSIQY